MKTIETKYGTLTGTSKHDTYENGELRDVVLVEENSIETPYGIFVPQFKDVDVNSERQKKNRSSISFHKNGEIKSLAFDSSLPVSTPIGEFNGELVTFYEDGSLNRFFQLNGMLSGYWSEDDEAALAEPIEFKTEFGEFETKIISMRFYPSGALKSVTLWPGESVGLLTPAGPMMVKTGFSLYESGKLKSVEPSVPTPVITEIGLVYAYDLDVLGVHGDSNSLLFTEEGKVSGFTTSKSGVFIVDDYGKITRMEAGEVESYVDEADTVTVPLKVTLLEEEVVIISDKEYRFARINHDFRTYDLDKLPTVGGGCSMNCSSCSSTCG